MTTGTKKNWLIQGYNSLDRLFAYKVSPALSEVEVGALLQRLAARDLSPTEIVGASVRKGMRSYNALLEVRKEHRERTILSVGENPHYIASLHSEAELADMNS